MLVHRVKSDGPLIRCPKKYKNRINGNFATEMSRAKEKQE
jgi:hypothetical protein